MDHVGDMDQLVPRVVLLATPSRPQFVLDAAVAPTRLSGSRSRLSN